MKRTWLVFVALIGFIAQPALADIYGLANGRSANMDNLAGLSVEGGVGVHSDVTTLGARINYKVSPDLMVFGDFGSTDYDAGGSGTAFGAGVFYQLRNVTLMENTDFAVKASYHAASVEDVDLSELAIDAIISGDQLSTTSFGWYANVGMHILKAEIDFGQFGTSSNDSNELLFGGGVTGALSFGEWYAGVDFIDGAVLVAGVRYNLQ